MFQSMVALRSYFGITDHTPLHDYLDDLEAFFWVFAYIILAYKPNGDRMPMSFFHERTLGGWSQISPHAAYDSKHTFFTSRTMVWEIRDAVDPGWYDVYDALFLEFRAYIWKQIGEPKATLIFTEKTTLPDGSLAPNRFEPILKKVDDHYVHIIGLFDAALRKIQGATTIIPEKVLEPTASSEVKPAPRTPLSTNSGDASSEPPSTASSATLLEDTSVVEKGPTSSLDEKAVVPTPSSTPPDAPTLPVEPTNPPPRSKRRYDEAELEDESPKESKRKCPPSRRQLTSVLGSVYQFCRTLFE